MTTRPLQPSELTAVFDPAALEFADTSRLADAPCGWIGQQRAEQAARFGLDMPQSGYNLFVLGEVGSGRSTLMFRLMQEVAANRPAAPDLVYLHNFDRPDQPLALRLAPGFGQALHQALHQFGLNIAHDIPRKLDEEGMRLDAERLKKTHRQPIEQAYATLVAFAADRHFGLRREEGRLVFTLLDEHGQVMADEVVLSLPAEERVQLENSEQELRAEIGRYLDTVRPIERDMEQALDNLRRDAVTPLLQRAIETLRSVVVDGVLDAPKFEAYLKGLLADVLQALDLFSPQDDDGREALLGQLSRYRANLLVDNRQIGGAPVIRDDDPVFRSLFGGIDYEVENGVLVTDFMHIRAGHLLRAHGGFLMLHLRDVVRDPSVWEKLQRYLRNGQLQTEEPAAAQGQLVTTTLVPEALAVEVKLVLIGSRDDYYDLQEADPEFARHFRVKVDFAAHFDASPETRRAIGLFVAHCCRGLGLPHFTAAAVARLIREMQREIDDQRRISASFGRLEALVIESAAHGRAASLIDVTEVEAALAARRMRHDHPERELLEDISAGELMILGEGSVIGQINGLAQADLGDYRFGSPMRITARVYAGDEGVLNIDREVELSGPTHDKGVFILQGWLSATFARLAPLCLSASLVFEQEYHGVEGDSASCAELFALLSALAGVALPQGMAVTGALNQHGEVMPVGGINEKIEGWYRTCRTVGWTGEQGVIIPARNRMHLMLDDTVMQAVADGEFRIYVIDHVLDGMALLTGMPTGEPDAAGKYPPDTLLGRVQNTLLAYRKACDESGHGHGQDHSR